MKNVTWLAIVLGIAGMALPMAADAEDNALLTAVYSRVSPEYHRQKLPDGSFKREFYALANGGYANGLAADRSIDPVRFPTVAGIVAQYLALQGYLFAKDSKSADLLLVISWGTTIPLSNGLYRTGIDDLSSAINLIKSLPPRASEFRSPDGALKANAAVAQAAHDELESALIEMQVFENMRTRANEQNARLLGYTDELNWRNVPSLYAGAGTAYYDLISDVESERYYVTILAYDFRAATQQKVKKLLWSTRVSIQRRGNRFDQSLATMVARASHYFGRDSGRLVRGYREGVVNLGELKLLGYEPEQKPPPPKDEQKR